MVIFKNIRLFLATVDDFEYTYMKTIATTMGNTKISAQAIVLRMLDVCCVLSCVAFTAKVEFP